MMRKIYYKKLIRDRIPKKIERSGGAYLIRRMKRKEFERELLKKAGEEASALPVAKSRTELISELADVIDVIEEIRRAKKIKSREIQKNRRDNFRNKGGFKKQLYLVWAEDTGYRTNEQTGSGRRRRT